MNLYNHLRVAALPLDIKDNEKQANVDTALSALRSLPKSIDIAVLPELFSTGFVSDPETALSLAEENNGRTIKALAAMASELMIAIAGSFLACNADGRLFNRAFFIEPGGESIFYDKRHLFILSKEAKMLTAGTKPSPVARFRGWNIALSVCYDMRFPVWCRNAGLRYDLLLVPANWPAKRSFAWTHLLQARAIENQACIVGANRSGMDKFGEYDGQTYIYDFMGKDAGEDKGAYVEACLSKMDLDKFRNDFPFWESADKFDIKID